MTRAGVGDSRSPLDALRPELAGLRIADPAERWRALGFEIRENRLDVGGVAIELGADGRGIVGWTLRNVPDGAELDGLATMVVSDGPAPQGEHPNGATGVDHVVITTDDFDRTSLSLTQAGLALRRIRDAGGYRQGFRRLGPAIMEIVEVNAQTGGAAFWGLVIVVADLPALAQRLAEQLGEIRPAVQPGRRIATLAAGAGLSTRLAFMTH